MLKYLTKFAVDILPSVAATVIGAYIVNHYIVTKPGAPPAASVSTTAVKAAAGSKPADQSTQVSSLPEAGVKARGMSERTLMERSAFGSVSPWAASLCIAASKHLAAQASRWSKVL